MGTVVCCHPRHSAALDRAATRGSGGSLSRKSDCLPPRDGGSWTLWGTMPEVWRKDSEDSLRRQRNQLLFSLPNRRENSSRSKFVAAVAIRLAAYTGRTRSS